MCERGTKPLSPAVDTECRLGMAQDGMGEGTEMVYNCLVIASFFAFKFAIQCRQYGMASPRDCLTT